MTWQPQTGALVLRFYESQDRQPPLPVKYIYGLRLWHTQSALSHGWPNHAVLAFVRACRSSDSWTTEFLLLPQKLVRYLEQGKLTSLSPLIVLT